MKKLKKVFLYLSGFTLLCFFLGLIIQQPTLWKPFAVATVVSLALGIGSIEKLKGYQYTAWIIVAIVAGMLYPSSFLKIGNLDLRNKWLILFIVQIVMFGMGTQMSIKDFLGLRSKGKGVLVGLLCHFSIMPIVAFSLTKVFHFPPEVAAGMILIGSCSSGLASNVMVYIANADLSLSVTLTAMSTLAAPIMTPLLMKFFADTYVDVKFIGMFIEIVEIVIVPIGAAFIYDALKNYAKRVRNTIFKFCGISIIWLVAISVGLWNYLDATLASSIMQWIVVLNFICGAVIFGVCYYYANKLLPKIDKLMPFLSMFGIVYFTTVTTAASQANLLTIGALLLVASVLHNGLGYFFGYWISRGVGLGIKSSRTVAMEVGLQNGGMALGIAGVMGKLATLGLAATIFSAWMNISGSVLANYWKKRPKDKKLKHDAVRKIQTIKST